MLTERERRVVAVSKTAASLRVFTVGGGGGGLVAYLAALLQLLLHLLGRLVDVDGQVRRQELADADALDLFVVLHTCQQQTHTLQPLYR